MSVRLSVRGLRKRLGDFTLRIDSLDLDGGVSVVVGPNGSGKTVFLKLLAGLLRPTEGSIVYSLDGREAPAWRALEFAVYVPTRASFPNARVDDILRVYGSPGRVEEAARLFGLDAVAGKRYRELSSGFRKRVQLAVAFSLPVRVMLLDEPFINVDSALVGVLEEALLRAAGEGRLVVVATHVPSRLLEYNVIVLDSGELVYSGRMPGLLEDIVEVSSGGRWMSLSEALRGCLGEYSVRVNPMLLAVFRRLGRAAS